MKRIAVVGGGITGLTAAYQLKESNLSPVLFEAGKSVGGAIETRETGGWLLERGPSTLQESPEQLSALIESLGLRDEVVEASPAAKNRFILKNGRLSPLPMSPPALIRTPLLSWKGKLRLFKEPFVARGRGIEDESLASFTRRRLGKEILEYFVNPFAAGIFAGDPEKLSVRYALPRLFALEQEHGSLFRGMIAAARKRREGEKGPTPRLISFRNGLSSLTRSLEKQMGDNLRLGATVESIAGVNGLWELEASQEGRTVREIFDAIILALPAKALAKLEFGKDGKDFSLASLNGIYQPPVATVSLGFRREQVAHPLDGFGMLMPGKEKRRILGTLFMSTLFPARAPGGCVLLTSFVGGSRQPELAEVSEESLIENVLEDLRLILGISGEPIFSEIHLWPEAIPQYETGHALFLEAIENFEAKLPGLFVAGACRDGISVGQCVASGFRHSGRAGTYLAGAPGFHEAGNRGK